MVYTPIKERYREKERNLKLSNQGTTFFYDIVFEGHRSISYYIYIILILQV